MQVSKRQMLINLFVKRISLTIVLFALIFSLTTVYTYTRAGGPTRAYAATSSHLNFQARLLNSSGNTVADGFYNVEFNLYTVSTGGVSEWTETRIGVNKVRVANGYLSVALGDVTAFPTTINWDQDHWLTMNIGGTGSPAWDGEMTPRLKLTAVPYAFQAKQAEKLTKLDGANTGILDFLALTANRTINLPDQNGTLCIQGSANCVDVSTTNDTLTTTSNSGLEISSDGLRLLGGCTDAQLLTWDETAKVWKCTTSGAAAPGFGTINAPSGTDPVGDGPNDTLNLTVSGSNFTITGDATTDSLSFDILESALAGNGLVANGDSLDVNTGAGLEIVSDAVRIDQNYSFTWTADQTWNLSETEDLAINSNISGTNSGQGQIITITNSTTSGSQYGLYVDNAASSGSTDSLLVLDNSDIDTAVTSAIQVINAGGGFTDLFDIAGTLISVAEFTVLDGGLLESEVTGVITDVTAGNGLTGGGASGNVTLNIGQGTGITVNGDDISVNYGSGVGTAVQGSTTLTCPTGTGDLSGGGTVITLGSGGTCSNITISEAPTFSTSVTTPLLTNAGALTVSTTGANDLTFTSGSGLINLNATTVATTSGLNFDLVNAANTTFSIGNSGAGITNLNLSDGGLQIAGTTVLTSGRALQNLTGLTIDSGGANISGGLSLLTGDLNVVAGVIKTAGTTRIDNTGNLTNIGNITGTGAVTISSTGGANALTLTSGSGAVVLGSSTLQHAGASFTFDLANAGTSTFNIANTNGSNVANLDVEGALNAGNGNAFQVNVDGDLTSVFTQLDGTSTTNGSAVIASTSLALNNAANFNVGNYVQVNSANCGGTGINPCYAKITAKATNTLTITPALTWANGSTVNEYHIPELGGTNLTQTLANRYGRGYFIAGVVTGNGTTYYNENSIESSLASFDLLNSGVSTLNIGGGATSINLGAAGSTVYLPGSLDLNGTVLSGSEISVLDNGVSLGTETIGDYVLSLGALAGLSTSGNSGEGSTPGLSVLYGSGANTAVQGNTTIICPSGSGNLTGGGTTVTLGAGGTCGAISTNNAVSFSTSVTTPLVTNAGPLTISTTGANDLTLTSGSGLIALNASTVQRIAAGATTFNFSDNSNTSVDFVNSGPGLVNLTVDGSGTFGNGLIVSVGGATIGGDISATGGLKIGNTFSAVAGTIRWTGLDFQGYDGTQWKSMTGGGVGGSTVVVEAGAGITKIKGSNQTVNNSTTLVNDNDLFVAIAANETRSFRFLVQGNSSTLADIKFAVTAPSGATCTVAVSGVSSGSANLGCGISAAVDGLGGDAFYEITGSVVNGSTAGNIQLQWAQNNARATNTIVYAQSFVHSTSTTADITALTHFKQNGNSFGATGVLGTTDNNGLNLIVNNATTLSLATSGLATFNGGVTANGLLTINSGGASINGGLNLNSSGITNAGSITGVGTNITASAGLTIASSGAGNLTLNSASGLAVLGATTLQALDSLVFDLQKASDTVLTLQNSGAGVATINLSDGGLQTSGVTRLSNGGALQNITGLTVTSGGASITGNMTIGSANTERLTVTSQLLGANALVFQGATDNAFATTLTIADPTANNTITIPNASGTLVLDTRSILTPAGSGLSGGGNLSVNRSLSLDINGLASNSSVNQTDYLAIYDGSGVKKITRSDFLQGIIGALQYRGTWDASTNTPTLSDATGSSGHEYAVSVGGTRNLGSGNITFGAGDFIIHNGTKWEVAPSSSDVGSVFGRTGIVVAQNGDYNGLQITNTAAGNIASTTVQAAINELDNEKLGSLNGLTLNSQTFANDANVTITSSGSTHTLGWSGQLAVSRGGTGANTFTPNGLVYGNGTGALQVTSAGTSGQVMIANASGVPTFTTLSGDVTVNGTGVVTIGTDRVTLGTDTTGGYVASLGTLVGLSASGNSGEGSTPGLSVLYGSTSNTAVQGNTQLTCASGAGNLTGGGTIITLGTGGTCANITTNNAVSFSTSVTTPLLTSSSGLTISSGGASGITINSASDILAIDASDTTLERTAAGTYTIDLIDGSNTTLSLTNSGVGVANLNIDGVYQRAGVSGLNTLSCTSGQYIGAANVRGGIVTAGACENDAGLLSDVRLKENIVQIDSTLDKMKGLNIVTYDYKCSDPTFADLRLDCSRQTGVLAQELEQIFPELVTTREDGFKQINFRALSFYNMKAVSELAKSVDSKGNGSFNTLTVNGVLEAGTIRAEHIEGLDYLGRVDELDAKVKALGDRLSTVENNQSQNVDLNNLEVGTLTATGDTSLQKLTVNLDLVAKGAMIIEGQATFREAVRFEKNVLLDGEINVLGYANVQGLTVNLDLIVKGAMVIDGKATFKEAVRFEKDVVFEKDVAVKGQATFNKDTAGYVTIKQGEATAKVTFTTAKARKPVIALTLGEGKFAQYSYRNVTEEGFEIILLTPATEDLSFSWVAIQTDEVAEAPTP